jgi:hypothetical protein
LLGSELLKELLDCVSVDHVGIPYRYWGFVLSAYPAVPAYLLT